MSDKEAKLAAARKRAEALKAKKAKKSDADKAEKADEGGAASAAEAGDAKPADDDDNVKETEDESKIDDSGSMQTEIDRLQGLLDESTAQQATLTKNLEEAQKQNKEMEKDLKARITDLEGSLARREDNAQTLELDLANIRKEKENIESELATSRTNHEKSEKDLKAANRKPDLQEELDNVKQQLEAARKAQQDNAASSDSLKKELSDAKERSAESEARLEEALAQNKGTAGAVSPRETEIQGKANALLSENQNLLSQLSELQTHLISVQDEKFALVESIERLQKELKDAKSSKSGHKNSSDVPRARISRDFERTASMQEVPLDEKAAAVQRNPADPPAELRSNIQIDLTSWYDKHAGEVIEV